MAEEQKTRIINLAEKTAPDSGDFFAVDSQAGGSKKIPTTALAKAADLTAEVTARTQADNALTSAINSASALIQNPTKTLSGALVSFTDGANMPMVACTAEIVPKQSGTGTPSPDNVRPISGWESVNLYKRGKNLLAIPYYDVSTTKNGITWTVNDDGTVTANGTATADSAFYLKYNEGYLPYGQYIFSGCPSSGSSSTYYVRVASYGGYNQVEDYGNGVTFNHTETIPAIANKLRIIITVKSGTTLNNAVFKPMIRAVGSSAEYESYTGATITKDLGQTVYGGEAEIVGGSLTDKMGMVDLGALSWVKGNRNDDNTGYVFSSGSISSGAKANENILCNKLAPLVPRVGSWEKVPLNHIEITSGGYIIVSADYADAASFKSAMNGVQLVYELATPQAYTLTGQEVETLVGDNNVWADSGDVEITYRRDISIVLENLENAING